MADGFVMSFATRCATRHPLREVIDCSWWDGDSAPLGRWGGPTFDAPTEAVDPESVKQSFKSTRERVLFALRGAAPKGLTTLQIAMRACTGVHRTSQMLRRLADLGHVVRIGTTLRSGERGRSVLVLWRLP